MPNIQPLGSLIEVSLALPSGCQLRAVGRVRWIREATAFVDDAAPSGMGLQFENLPPEASQAIQQFLLQRDPILYED